MSPSGHEGWHREETVLYWVELLICRMRVAENSSRLVKGGASIATENPNIEVPQSMWPTLQRLIQPTLDEIGMTVKVFRSYHKPVGEITVLFKRRRRTSPQPLPRTQATHDGESPSDTSLPPLGGA